MSAPEDFRSIALEILRAAMEAGDLPRDVVEEAAEAGNTLAEELLNTTP
jgi:hypothetical protein